MRAITPPSQLEVLRRMGVLRSRRNYAPGDIVYRVRRGMLVRVPDAFTNPDRLAGERRKRWGMGRQGRMDWERQQRVIASHARGRVRRYSRFTRDMIVAKREQAVRWDVRGAMAEWLYAWELDLDYRDCDDYDDYDDDWWDDWVPPQWSVTLPDLMR